MKKLFNICLAIIITVVCAFSLTACAVNDDGADGKTGLIISKDKKGNYIVRDFVYVEGCLKEGGILDIKEVLEEKGIPLKEDQEARKDIKIKISTGAFDGDDKITKLIVSDEIDEIEQGAFRNMKSLETLEVPFVGKNAKTDAVQDQTLETEGKACNMARTFSHFFGTTAYNEGRKMNNGEGDVYVPYKLRTVIVNATKNVDYSVLDKEGYAIGFKAFKNANALENIVLQGVNLKEIGEEAFSGCTELKTITLPSSIKTVYASAFSGCTKLTDVVVEGTGVVLKNNVFSGCTAMKKVNNQVDLTVDLSCFDSIGNNAFDFGREVEYSVRNRGEFDDIALNKIFGDTTFKVI